MLEEYITIEEKNEAELVIKKSQFIANIFPISTEQDFKEKMKLIKKKYHNAKHNVFAYRLANGTERYSDDGEPAGTAGVPILDILRGNDYYDVLIVVTRYFGGILLGTGGLVKAYSDVSKLVIEKTKTEVKRLAVQYNIVVPYNEYNTVLHYCSKKGFDITDSHFSDTVLMKIRVNYGKMEEFTKELTEILDGKVDISRENEYFYI